MNYFAQFNSSSHFQPNLLKKSGQGQGIPENIQLWAQVGLLKKHTKLRIDLMLKLIDKTQSKEWTYLEKALHVLEDVDPTVAEVCLLGDLSGGAPPDLLLQVERSLLLSVPFNLEIPITQKIHSNLNTEYFEKKFLFLMINIINKNFNLKWFLLHLVNRLYIISIILLYNIDADALMSRSPLISSKCIIRTQSIGFSQEPRLYG